MIAPSSILTVVAESAARSLLLAAGVGAGLALLRTRNVPARKTAWMLVLAASFAMPLLARWAASASWIPQSAAFVLSGRTWHSTPAQSVGAVAAPVATAAEANSGASTQLPTVDMRLTGDVRQAEATADAGPHFPAPTITSRPVDSPSASPAPRPVPILDHALATRFSLSRSSVLLMLYLAVCGAFLVRLAYGAWVAMNLWRTATPVEGEIAPGIRVRSSTRIASPITLGPGVVLPASYREWDREKLRIVLAHEASHVRQRDFYLQLCACLYAAIFWFSPLGWWLKRILADLGETISDRAAVEHAASHASYAQVLLEFAALPRPIATGVAMAHQGSIVPRIERLLNESSFRQAFAGGRGRIAAAVILVGAAGFFSTAMVRVQAASRQSTPVAAPAQTAPESPAQAAPVEAGQQSPSTVAPPATVPAAGEPSQPAVAPAAADDDASHGGPEDFSVAIAPPAAVSSDGTAVLMMPRGTYTLAVPNARMMAGQARAMALLQAQKGQLAPLARKNFYRYGFGSDGNAYAYVTGEGEKNMHFSGSWYKASQAEIEKARSATHGDFIWFERDGKSYVIDDPAVLAGLKPMQDEMDELGRKQDELGKQQDALGKQQEALGKQMEQVKVPTPDMKKELEKLQAVTSKLSAMQGKTASQEELAELEGQLAEVQGKLGGLQGDMGGRMGELGGKMGELGEQQGKLGEEQGKFGAQQGRIAREMDGKILSMIDECLKNGKARQVK